MRDLPARPGRSRLHAVRAADLQGMRRSRVPRVQRQATHAHPSADLEVNPSDVIARNKCAIHSLAFPFVNVIVFLLEKSVLAMAHDVTIVAEWSQVNVLGP